jgi:ssDNA-specific exonuclease RecJ
MATRDTIGYRDFVRLLQITHLSHIYSTFTFLCQNYVNRCPVRRTFEYFGCLFATIYRAKQLKIDHYFVTIIHVGIILAI